MIDVVHAIFFCSEAIVAMIAVVGCVAVSLLATIAASLESLAQVGRPPDAAGKD